MALFHLTDCCFDLHFDKVLNAKKKHSNTVMLYWSGSMKITVSYTHRLTDCMRERCVLYNSDKVIDFQDPFIHVYAVSYTHLTLPTMAVV